MADEGYVIGLLAGIPDQTTRKVLEDAFREVLRQIRLGEPEHHQKATNFAAFYQDSTTAGSTSEFSFQHGMNVTPRLAIPVLNLNKPGASVVPLEVSRAADGRRVYLKSTSTSAAITLLVE